MGIKKHAEKVFERLVATSEDPQTELEYTCHYTLLIAVLLSAQTTDRQVNKCTRLLFKKAHTPKAMMRLTEEEIASYINTLGLYKQKAKHVLETSRLLVQEYQGQVPDTREALETLPGVGRKTANVVLNVAFNQPTMPVDTHVLRVSQRLGLSKGTTPFAVEQDLYDVIPTAYMQKAHHWLILHGRYVCKARSPLCNECVVKDLCPYSKSMT